MNKHLEIDSSTLSEQIKDIEPIELIVWAFEHGYKLGKHDTLDGIHIKPSELKKQLTNDIVHYLNHRQSKLK